MELDWYEIAFGLYVHMEMRGLELGLKVFVFSAA